MDNEPVTGIRLLPDKEGTDEDYFYNCGEDGVASLYTGWYQGENGKMYIENGVVVTGMKEIDGVEYYFGADGYAVKGVFYYASAYHYSNDNYEHIGLYSGFVRSAKGLRYADGGKPVTGYKYLDSEPYYFDGNAYAYQGEYVLCGETCTFVDGQYVSCSTADLYDAGMIGTSIQYVIYTDGTMVMQGTGQTYSFDNAGTRPFNKYTSKIKTLKIGDGITKLNTYVMTRTGVSKLEFGENPTLQTVGSAAFYECTSLVTVELPDSVTGISNNAFGGCTNLEKIVIPKATSVTYANSFKNCSKVVLYVANDSTALSYAKTNSYNYYIYDAVVVNEVIQNDDGTVSFDVTVPTDIPETAQVIVAGYGANGYCDMDVREAFGTDNLTISSADVTSIRVFVWDGLSEMCPLTIPVEELLG